MLNSAIKLFCLLGLAGEKRTSSRARRVGRRHPRA